MVRRFYRTPALTWKDETPSLEPPQNKFKQEFDRIVLPVSVLGISYNMIFWRNGKSNPPLQMIGPVTEVINIWQFYRYDLTITTLTVKTQTGQTVAQYVNKGAGLVSVY